MNTKVLPHDASGGGPRFRRGPRFWLRPSLLAAALVALPLATEPLSAQVVLAARAGMSLATLAYSSDPGVDIGYRRGVSVGLSATYYPAEKVGIRVGGAFVSKGAEAQPNGNVTATMKINYAELSSLLDVRAPIGEGGASLHLLAGPTLSFKRLCEIEAGPQDDRAKGPCENIDLDIRAVDFGGKVGAGITLPVIQEPAVALSLEALYTLGLTEFENFLVDNPAKNRALAVQAGLSFPVG